MVFPLNITKGGSIAPIAEIHSIKEVQAFDPGCFFYMKRRFLLPTTRPLTPWPSIIPASSIFQRFSGLIARIAGTSNLLNQGLIISVVAPLTRTESIRSCLLVYRIGFRLRKPRIHRFPSVVVSPRTVNIRCAKSLIYEWVGQSPRLSWTSTQSVKRFSWVGVSLWRGIAASWCDSWP